MWPPLRGMPSSVQSWPRDEQVFEVFFVYTASSSSSHNNAYLYIQESLFDAFLCDLATVAQVLVLPFSRNLRFS
jgi:hypothetical protein